MSTRNSREEPRPVAAESTADTEHENGTLSTSVFGGGPEPVECKNEEQAAKPKEEGMTKMQIVTLMFALSIGTFLAAIDQTIVSTALPSIAESFSASAIDYTWIGSAYLLPAAASPPPWGKLSDIWGRKPMILLANVVFVIGSLIGALSVNIRMLIAGRVIQGIGGGGVLSLVYTVIGDMFSQRDRSLYYGIIGIVWGLAGGIGPILGGVFAKYVSWRWCFWINLPIDGIGFITLLFFLRIETPKTPLVDGLKAMDWLGTTTVVGGTVMFLLGLVYGGVAYPWDSPTVICLIIFGLLTLVIFVVFEWKVAKYPLAPMRLFKSPSNNATFGIAFIHGFVYIADMYYLPLYFQSVIGASPLLSGVYILPVTLMACFCSTLTGGYIKKTGRYRPPLYFGTALMLLGHGLYIDLKPYASWPRIIIYQLITAIGIGPLFQAPIISIFSQTKPADVASAAAFSSFARAMGTAISVVIGGVIFQNRMAAHYSQLRSVLPSERADMLTHGDATASTNLIQTFPAGVKQVVLKAYTDSLQAEWIFYTAVSAVALGLSFLVSKQVLSKEHKIGKTGLAVQEAARLEEENAKKAKKGVDIES
ncbi:hypothetical protein VTN00DRAFT_8259 [Thermoascus crustaceus]|uniref:uncharacterized protein n=1 Tax=Thermoascus crustaceus TaxID=5088 RepID=UPI0037441E58